MVMVIERINTRILIKMTFANKDSKLDLKLKNHVFSLSFDTFQNNHDLLQFDLSQRAVKAWILAIVLI